MGCDIHLFVEHRTESGWKEFVMAPGFDGRNYDLFHRLAGARTSSVAERNPPGYLDDLPPLFSHRGHPDDLSDEAMAFFDHQDLHSFTWCTLKELKSEDWTREHGAGSQQFQVFVNKLSYEAYMEEITDEDDVRVLIAFNN